MHKFIYFLSGVSKNEVVKEADHKGKRKDNSVYQCQGFPTRFNTVYFSAKIYYG